MMIVRLVTSLLLCFFSAAVFAQNQPKLEISASMAAVYQQGQSDEVKISVKLLDPEVSFSTAVVFLNVVEDAPGYPQAAHKIFVSANEAPKVFQVVHLAEALRQGVGTNLVFALKDAAKPGNYSLVIQVFADANTDPHKVNINNRIALKGFNFQITPR